MVNGKTMISLASPLKSSGQQPASQGTKGGKTSTQGAAHAFQGALAATAPAKDGEADAEATPSAELAGKTAPGTALPISLRSGKTLPVSADPVAATAVAASTLVDPAQQDATAPADPAQAEDEAPATPDNAAQALTLLAQLALPQGAALPQASGDAAGTPPDAAQPKGSPAGQGSLLAKAAPEPLPAGQAPTPSVTVHVAAQTNASGEPVTGPGQDSRVAKEDRSAKADASFGTAPIKMEAPLPSPVMVSPNPLVDAVRHGTHDGAKAGSPIAAMHDLTNVVDRLVAAREAFAPATAAITLQHGELGDLSLRFDQNRNGHLAVQLSASDPEAHRAVVAAVSDAGFRGTADGQTATSQQSAQSQASARGGSAERDSGSAGNGAAARHDQPQQRRPATHGQERPGGDQRHAGVFA
jgi:hypothetical protein